MSALRSVLPVTLTALLLAGCASSDVKRETGEDFNQTRQKISALQQRQASNAALPPIVLPMSPVLYVNGKSVAPGSVRNDLPRVLRSENKVHFKVGVLVTAEQFGRLLAEEIGLPVKVGAAEPMPQQPNAMLPTVRSGVRTVDLSALQPMPLQQLLNVVTPQFGLDWDYYDDVLHLEASFRKSYKFSNSASDSKSVMTLGKTSQAATGATGSSAGSSGNFNSELRGEIRSVSDPWSETEASIRAIAGEKNVVANRSLGMFTVNCSKVCHKLVAAFINDANHVMTRQVLLHVVEVTVASTATGQSGVNWDLVYQKVAGSHQYAFSFGSPASLVGNAAGNVTQAILNPVNGSGGGNRFAGSNLIFSALSAASRIVEFKPFDLILLNNEPTTLSNTDQQSYTASTSVIPMGVAGTPVYSRTPGYVTYGQLIQATPTVLADDSVMIRFGIDDTKLKQLVVAASPNDIDRVMLGQLNLNAKAILKSGSTLILSGFKRKISTMNEQGLLKDQQLGSEAGNIDSTETVILITPYQAGV